MAEPTLQYRDVVSRDGVRLRVRLAGPPEAPAILFIHGYSQCHLSWKRQFEGALAREFRLAAFDLRGHGWSDRPTTPEAYQEGGRWAGDVAAVIEALTLERTVLVGWSYGGRVVCNYLEAHGTAAIAGINFVAPVLFDDGDCYGDEITAVGKAGSDDPQTALSMLRRFGRSCFASEPDRNDFETLLAYSAMVPPDVRRLIVRRPLDHHELLASLDVPVLLTHGSADAIIAPAMSKRARALISDARLSLYDGIGHSPFYEDAERFDRELADFVRRCAAVTR